MSLAEVPAVLILAGLAAYVGLAGADFGAGFWDLTARAGADRVREHTHRALAPVWEANHVWLIFVLVVCWTAYPEAFGSIFSTLAAPLLLAAIGIILRGASYAARSAGESPTASAVFSLSSIVTPFALGAAIGAIASGRVPTGNAAGDLFASWLNPTSIAIGTLAVATSAYLAAVYLAGDAHRIGSPELLRAFRSRALGAGVAAGILALVGIAVVAADAERLFDGLTRGAGLAAVIVSALGGIATLALVARGRYGPARFSAALAVATIVAGWGLAQAPELLPGLTIEEAAAGEATLVALLIGVAAGLVILIPSLALLFGLVLRGRFDAAADVATVPAERAAAPGGPGRRRGAAVIGLIALGVPLTLLADGVLFALGVVLMLAFVAAAFAVLVSPETLSERDSA
ncbi:MAG: cytochrome d ubiquinol oxidase subunit II [Thermoleophilaceae bacterium]